MHNESAISRIKLIKTLDTNDNNKFPDLCLKMYFFYCLVRNRLYFICPRMANEILQNRKFINIRLNNFLFKNCILKLFLNMF